MYLSETTVVTAFYNLKSARHPFLSLKVWMQRLCRLPAAMVIYTSEDLAFDIYRWRKPYLDRTVVEVRRFDSFGMTCPAMMHFWNGQAAIDSEGEDPELYATRALRQELVRTTMNRNKFQSRWFVWCDCDIPRFETLLPLYMAFPAEVGRLCEPARLTLLEVAKIPDSYVVDWVEKKPLAWPVPDITLGSECMVGDAAAWTEFGAAYKDALKEFAYRGWCAGKDQMVLFMMLMEHRTEKPFRLFFAKPLGSADFQERYPGTEWLSMPAILGGTVDAVLDTRFEDDDEGRNALPRPLGL